MLKLARKNIGLVFLGVAVLASGYKVTHSYNNLAVAVKANTAVIAKSNQFKVEISQVIPSRKAVPIVAKIQHTHVSAIRPQHKPIFAKINYKTNQIEIAKVN